MISLLVFSLLAVGVSSARAEGTTAGTRTAPYDFGCLWNFRGPGSGGVCDNWEEARNGSLRGGAHPGVYITYLLTPILTTWYYGSNAGIYLEFEERSRITLSAVVRRDEPVDAGDAHPAQACLGAEFSSYVRYGCQILDPNGEPTVITTDFDGRVSGPGIHAFFVSVSAGYLPAQVRLESISYEVTPAPST
jgi:hypothetical protein